MSKNRLWKLVPVGVGAVVLSITSLAYACTTMGGQTYIDSTFKNNEPNPGDTITAHANGLTQLASTAPEYFLMQDGNQMYCHEGASKISSGLGRGTTNPFNTGSITGTLDPDLGGGEFYICVSNYTNSAWPQTLVVY